MGVFLAFDGRRQVGGGKTRRASGCGISERVDGTARDHYVAFRALHAAGLPGNRGRGKLGKRAAGNMQWRSAGERISPEMFGADRNRAAQLVWTYRSSH